MNGNCRSILLERHVPPIDQELKIVPAIGSSNVVEILTLQASASA